MAVATKPRKTRIFGPLTYATLAVGGVAIVISGSITARQRFQEWAETRQLIAQARVGQEAAVLELAHRMGPEQVLPYLHEAARSSLASVRASGVRTLTTVTGDPAQLVSVLSNGAADPDDTVRLEAARGLTRVPGVAAMRRGGNLPLEHAVRAEALRALERLRGDPSPSIRVAAVASLTAYAPRSGAHQVADASVTSALVSSTHDKDPEVRFAAVQALREVNGPEDPSTVEGALKLIADLDSPVERRKLVELLHESSAAVQARAVAELVKLLEPFDPNLLPDVLDGLVAAGPQARPALPILERLRAHQEPMVRTLSAQAIVAIEGPQTPRGAAALIAMITDASLPQDARFEALNRVRELGPTVLATATPGLIRQLGDPALEVRMTAHSLLAGVLEMTPAKVPAGLVGP
jgi:hypothetical protein